MKTTYKYSLTCVLLFLSLIVSVQNSWASSFYVGRPNVKLNSNFDPSTYILPNGMQFQEILNLQSSYAQESTLNFQNAYTLGESGTTQIGKMTVDALGNRYVTGGFTGTIEYGGVTLQSSGGYDFFIAKLSPEGNVLWYQTARGSEELEADFSIDGGLAIAVDNDGNAYVGGSFVKHLHFLNSSGDTLHTLRDGREDALINLELFVAKYDNEGRFLWALGGESGSDAAENSLHLGINSVNSIILDEDGYPYVAGGFAGTSLFDEEVSVFGESDFFIASLSKEGDYTYWVDVFGTPDWEYAKSISVDTLGYLNILGVVGEGRMDLPFSDQYWVNDTGEDDTFIISYDINGEWYFASFMGAGEQIVGNSIASSKDGSIYVSGFFSGTASFVGSDETIEALGLSDGYIVKYDIHGDMVWARHFGFENATADVVTLDENEDVIVLGRYSESIIFDAHSETPVILTTTSESNMYMAKFDKNGAFIWAKNIEGTGAESKDFIFDESTRPFASYPLDIMTSSHNGGEIILAGDFDGTLFLDEITLSTSGSRQVFVGVIPIGDVVSIAEEDKILPTQVELLQNYPNPFNPSTTIGFNLPQASQVSITVFNIMGQKVATLGDRTFSAGQHSISWEAKGLSSGTYFYQLSTENFTQTKKMNLIK